MLHVVCFGIAVAVGLIVSPSASAEQIIRCRSNDYQYNHCPTREHGPIRLTQQISKSACIEGRTWGYDRRGVWVDQGCDAKFEWWHAAVIGAAGATDVARTSCAGAMASPTTTVELMPLAGGAKSVSPNRFQKLAVSRIKPGAPTSAVSGSIRAVRLSLRFCLGATTAPQVEKTPCVAQVRTTLMGTAGLIHATESVCSRNSRRSAVLRMKPGAPISVESGLTKAARPNFSWVMRRGIQSEIQPGIQSGMRSDRRLATSWRRPGNGDPPDAHAGAVREPPLRLFIHYAKPSSDTPRSVPSSPLVVDQPQLLR